MSKKKLVIAVDFNGTCVTYCYPEGTGEDIGSVPVLKRLLAEGHQLVLTTGIEREGEFELPMFNNALDIITNLTDGDPEYLCNMVQKGEPDWCKDNCTCGDGTIPKICLVKALKYYDKED